MPELYAWIARVMKANALTYEVIFVNDGSTDRSWQVIEQLAEQHEQVKGIKFRRNYGKSPALFCFTWGTTGSLSRTRAISSMFSTSVRI